MELDKALSIARRYVPEAEALRYLDETQVVRTVEGQEREFYDPYAASLAYLMHPDTVKQRTEGEVSETYIDMKELVAYLKGKSAALIASWPPDDSFARAPIDLRLDINPWGA